MAGKEKLSDEDLAKMFIALGNLAKVAGIKIGLFQGGKGVWLDEVPLPGESVKSAQSVDEKL